MCGNKKNITIFKNTLTLITILSADCHIMIGRNSCVHFFVGTQRGTP